MNNYQKGLTPIASANTTVVHDPDGWLATAVSGSTSYNNP